MWECLEVSSAGFWGCVKEGIRVYLAALVL